MALSISSDETPLLYQGLDSPEQQQRTSHSLLRPKAVNRMSSSEPTPERPHVEKHMGQYDAIMRDVIIGFSDGLTVPFALTAGLSSLGNTKIVIMGGLAELCSGMISMGLGAYLAADTERQHWYVPSHHPDQNIILNKTPGKPSTPASPPRSTRSRTSSAPRSTTSSPATASATRPPRPSSAS
jgi:hypothetical protein